MRDVLQEERMKALLHVRIAPLIETSRDEVNFAAGCFFLGHALSPEGFILK
jgi:hypothetical protein